MLMMSWSHVPIEPLFLWFRRVIRVENDLSEIYIPTECGGGSWKMFMCAHACECVCTRWLYSCLFTRVLLMGFLCYCFIVCIKVFVRNMFVSEDEPYFYHSNDLTQLELRLMCLAFFRLLTLCVCVCVYFCVFFFCRGGEHRWLEPAATPVGLKFACFPPICSTQPNQRQHCVPVCSKVVF